MNLQQMWNVAKGVMNTIAFVYFVITLAIFIYTMYYHPELLELTIALPLHVVIVLILFAVLQNAIAGVTSIRRLLKRRCAA